MRADKTGGRAGGGRGEDVEGLLTRRRHETARRGGQGEDDSLWRPQEMKDTETLFIHPAAVKRRIL